MHPANGQKVEDPEKSLGNSPTSTTSINKQQPLEQAYEKKSAKMQRTQHFLFTLLLVGLLAIGVVCTSSRNPHHRDAIPAISTEEAQEFQELLNTVEPSSLHEILHKHLKDKYQHGIYQEDKTAMEVVHQQDAEVARDLIELAKRQISTNETTAAPPPSSTVSVTQLSTSTVPPTSTVVVPPSSTQNTQPPSSSAPPPVSSTESRAPSSTASNQAPTTTSAQASNTPSPSSASSQSIAPGSTLTRNLPSGSPSAGSSSAPNSQGSSQASSPASSTQGSNSSPSSTPDVQSSITQEVVYVTTLANGAQSTVTSITVVPANPVAQTGRGSGSSTNTADTSLQTNAGNKNSLGFNIVLGGLGVIVVAAL